MLRSSLVLVILLALAGCSPPTPNSETLDGRAITVRHSVRDAGACSDGCTFVTLYYRDGRFKQDGRKGRLPRAVGRALIRAADAVRTRSDLADGVYTNTCAGNFGPRESAYTIHRMPRGLDTQGWGGKSDIGVATCQDVVREDAPFFRALARAEREIARRAPRAP